MTLERSQAIQYADTEFGLLVIISVSKSIFCFFVVVFPCPIDKYNDNSSVSSIQSKPGLDEKKIQNKVYKSDCKRVLYCKVT